MTILNRTPLFPNTLFYLTLCALSACGSQSPNYINITGTYGDGTPVTLNQEAYNISCDSTTTMIPCVTLKTLDLVTANTQDWLAGLRIDYVPSKMSSPMSYPSGVLEPVTVYAVRFTGDTIDPMEDSSIEGGEVGFTHIASGPGQTTQGSLSNLVLQRPGSNGTQQTLLTITSGTFQYVWP